MKHLISFLMTALILTSCRSDDSQKSSDLKPMLSTDRLTMTVGESKRISVTNAEHIYARPSSDIVLATVRDNNIDITATSAGNTTIHITADRTPLTCTVTVSPIGPSGDKPDMPQLFDSQCRFESPGLTLKYSTPGTIVTVGQSSIEFRSLDTGDHIVSTPSAITVNDKTINLPRQTEKSTADTTWYRHADATADYWIVVENAIF